MRGYHRGKWSTTSNTDQNQIQLILDGYTQLVTDRIKQGWSCYLVTILFQQLPGSQPTINRGLHFHALILIPDRSRLREPLQDHFQTSAHLYETDGTITKIDVRPVLDGYERVVDYVFKTIKRERVSYDEGVLILPRTRDELTSSAIPRDVAQADQLAII